LSRVFGLKVEYGGQEIVWMVIARSPNLLGKITVLVIVGLCVNTALALDGSGTQEDPWLIKSLEDFNDFAADPNYWAGFTRLETDVNLVGQTYTKAVIAPDTSISYGFQGNKFIGFFDGNDHKILNLTIDYGGAGNDFLGLFGCIGEYGEVKNLGLKGVSISGSSESYRVGGLVGLNDGGVSNCHSTCEVYGIGWDVGGLVGVNDDLGSISNCYASGSVTGQSYVGGLVGSNNGDVSNCHSTGGVNGGMEVGGLMGFSLGDVSICYSICDVNGVDTVGGLVGWNIHGDILNCYSTGDVNGVYTVGGLGGCNWGGFSNCYSTGHVSGYDYVGGLVGLNNGNFSICYSTSDVNGVDDVGGLVGVNYNDGSASNCFWDIDTQTNGVTESIGRYEGGTVTNVAGLPTSQMQTGSTFTDAGWDFINAWNIGENQTYPYLRAYLPSDINKDGIVNFLDVAITANQWMEEQ
jgi:hypothetical protein